MSRGAERVPPLAAEVVVTAVEDLSPSFRRLRLAGPELHGASRGLIGDGPRIVCADAYLKVVIPPPGTAPQRPALSQGLPAWFARPAAERGWLRTYTARSARWIELDGQSVPEIVVDVVLHDLDAGPGGRWAAEARPGDVAHLVVPARGEELWSSWRPGEAARVVVVGDETAAPALVSIAEQLQTQRPELPAEVILEVPHDDDAAYVPAHLPRQRSTPGAGLRLHLLPRSIGQERGRLSTARLAEVLGAPASAAQEVLEGRRPSSSGSAPEPDAELVWTLAQATGDGTYVLLAGEASIVKAWRRLCVDAAGLPRDAVTFMGYWRQGRAEG